MGQDYEEFPQISQRLASAHKALEPLLVYLLQNTPFVAYQLIIILL